MKKYNTKLDNFFLKKNVGAFYCGKKKGIWKKVQAKKIWKRDSWGGGKGRGSKGIGELYEFNVGDYWRNSGDIGQAFESKGIEASQFDFIETEAIDG